MFVRHVHQDLQKNLYIVLDNEQHPVALPLDSRSSTIDVSLAGNSLIRSSSRMIFFLFRLIGIRFHYDGFDLNGR